MPLVWCWLVVGESLLACLTWHDVLVVLLGVAAHRIGLRRVVLVSWQRVFACCACMVVLYVMSVRLAVDFVLKYLDWVGRRAWLLILLLSAAAAPLPVATPLASILLHVWGRGAELLLLLLPRWGLCHGRRLLCCHHHLYVVHLPLHAVDCLL